MGKTPRGTILYLPCDSDLADKSGSNNDGYFFNGAPYFDKYGVFSSCLRLNWSGQGTQYIHSAVTPITDPGEWTISLWFFLSDLLESDSPLFVNGDWLQGFGFGITSDEGFGLVPFGTSPWGSNQYLAFFNTNAPNTFVNTYAEFIFQNMWYHLVMRRKDGVVSFFVNGEKIAYEYSGDVPAVDPTKGYYIGGMPNYGYSVGKMDEIFACNVGLSDDEVIDLFMSFYPVKFFRNRYPVSVTFTRNKVQMPKPMNVTYCKFDPVKKIPATLTPTKMPSSRTLGNVVRKFIVADTHEWSVTQDITVLDRVKTLSAVETMYRFVESVPREWMNLKNIEFIANPIIRYQNLNLQTFTNTVRTMGESTYVRNYADILRTMGESTYVRGYTNAPRTMGESLVTRSAVQFFTESMINRLPFTYANIVAQRHLWKGNDFSDMVTHSSGKSKLTIAGLRVGEINRGFHEFSSLPFRIKQEFSRLANMMITSVRSPKHCVLKVAMTPFADVAYRNQKHTATNCYRDIQRWMGHKLAKNAYTSDGKRKYGDLPIFASKLVEEMPMSPWRSKTNPFVKENMGDWHKIWKKKEFVLEQQLKLNFKAPELMKMLAADTPAVKPMMNVDFQAAPSPSVKDLKSVKFSGDPNSSAHHLIPREWNDTPRPYHGMKQNYITSKTHRLPVNQNVIPRVNNHVGNKGSFDTTKDRVLMMMEKQWLKRPNVEQNNKSAKANFMKYVDKKMKLSRDVSERVGKIKRFLATCTPWKKED